MAYDISARAARLAPVFEVAHDYRGTHLLYKEPERARHARIRASASAMTELIVDDSLPRWIEEAPSHPLFLSMKGRDGQPFGRASWVEDLGALRHRPAYDHLREVWLHDCDSEMRHIALPALCELGDERVLPDIARCLKKDPLDWGGAVYYAVCLGKFKSDAAVRVAREIADIGVSLYRADVLFPDKGEMQDREERGIGPLSPLLNSAMWALRHIGTDAAHKEMREIARVYPYDRLVNQPIRKFRDPYVRCAAPARLELADRVGC